MSSTRTTFPAPRVAPDPRHAFAGVFRLTFARLRAPGHWLALGGSLLLLGFIFAGFLSSDARRAHFLDWAVAIYFTVLVPITTFILAAGAVRDDLRAGMVEYVFTRPIGRSAFVLFKYLAQLAALQLDFLFAFGLLVALAVYRGTPGTVAAIPILLLGQVLLIVAFAAFGFLAGILTSRYIVVGIVYGVIVELSVGQIPTQLSQLSMTHEVRQMLLAHLNPGLAQAATAAGDLHWMPDQSPFTVTALTLGYAAIMLALAAGAFALQELAGTGTRES